MLKVDKKWYFRRMIRNRKNILKTIKALQQLNFRGFCGKISYVREKTRGGMVYEKEFISNIVNDDGAIIWNACCGFYFGGALYRFIIIICFGGKYCYSNYTIPNSTMDE